MTNREFNNAVITLIEEGPEAVDVLEIRKYAIEANSKLDERNYKRSSTLSKAQMENQILKDKIYEFYTSDSYLEEHGNEYKLAALVAVDFEISVQKASALLRQLVEEGLMEVAEVKVPKKGKQKAYRAKG